MSIPHVAAAVFGRPWFITPEAMSTIADVVGLRTAGVRLASDEVVARLQAAAQAAGPRPGARVQGAVGVIPVYGTIFHRANLMTEFSGGATVQGITRSFREALADPAIGSIIMEFDSPGGEVAGVDELAAEIRAARGTKPIIAIANTMMASGAYYLAAQADEIVATPSALVGSIGCVIVHQETSQADAAEGVTTTILRKPDAKYRGNSYEPLNEDATASLQGIVDDAYDAFVTAIAKGRGIRADAVRNGYGKGEILTSQRALAAGLVDRVATLDDTVRRLASGKTSPGRGAGAEAPEFPVSVEGTEDRYDAETVAAAFGVPADLVGDDPTVGSVQQAEANAGSLQLELDRDSWLLNS